MAREGVDRRISSAAAAAAAATVTAARPASRLSNPKSIFALFPVSRISGLYRKLVILGIIVLLTWAYLSTRPPPPRISGVPGNPPITAPRVKLRDGRHLAYTERGVPKNKAKYKFVYSHGFGSSRQSPVIAGLLPQDFIKRFRIYVVSFDRPGYGESDPHPQRTPKSLAFDVQDLADQLQLGQKFYVIGFSMGGQAMWPCLKYIPDRLAGVTLLAPVINYWWPGLPADLSTEEFHKQRQGDVWSQRVAHYAPWLTYWWNTQKMFPSSSAISHFPEILSRGDKQLLAGFTQGRSAVSMGGPQGVYESLHRDMMIGFGKSDFDPTELTNPFVNSSGSVHLWQGDDDPLVPVRLQRSIARKLPWIRYHEMEGAGHMLPFGRGMSVAIIKSQLSINK